MIILETFGDYQIPSHIKTKVQNYQGGINFGSFVGFQLGYS